ncbi:hypothetical protein DM02DRAFT_661574 [Periconia macrospinosa]|uniref:Uncharacterized protein n=1 Tax=Periconia macrospinosa TaxID=97972 RepID=A0A2V1D711_9PLEO|nr:hypothetical protein DM02DRAFT_661574 [Periconia macrospinosa]
MLRKEIIFLESSVTSAYMMGTWKNPCVFFSDTWALELSLLLLSWTALFTTVGLLLRYDQKPIFTWLDISLNAVISMLGIVFKSSLTFVLSSCLGQWTYISLSSPRRQHLSVFITYDDASRGPLGSLLLLWRTRLSSWAAIGAFTVIISFFLDPFLQQIISLSETQTAAIEHPPTVPYVTHYDKGASWKTKYKVNNGTNPPLEQFYVESRPDFCMQAAIFSGLSGPRVRPVHVRCPTAVCQWEPFKTLAVCSTFANVTSEISKRTVSWPWKSNHLQDYDYPLVTGSEEKKGLKDGTLVDYYQLPHGLYIEAAKQNSIRMVTKSTLNRTRTISFQDNSAMLWSIVVLQDTAAPKGADDQAEPVHRFIAYEISLSMCIKEVTSRSINGTLYESMKDIDSTILKGGNPKDGEAPHENSGKLALYVEDVSEDLEFEGGITITQQSLKAIAKALETTFAGNLMPSSAANGFYRMKNNDSESIRYDPLSMERIYNSLDPKALFENVAESMTNNLRSNDAHGSLAKGTQEIIVYQIRWVWISLPATALFGGTVSLFLAMCMTRKYRAPLWKSCALAMMKCGAQSAATFDDCEDVSAMEEVAEKTFIRISKVESKSTTPNHS